MTMTMTMPRLCVLGLALLSLQSLSTATASQAASNAPKKPSFVSHVDRPALETALTTAKERHGKAVQQALRNYPTDDATPPTTQQLAELDKVQLNAFHIKAPGAIPDFSSILDRTVFVTDKATPLLTVQECAQVVQDAEAHFIENCNGQWSTQKSGQYEMAGFWIKSIPSIHAWFVDTVKQRLFPLLAKTFPDFIQTPDDLCVDNAYMFKYTAETGRRTDVHTDSGCLSFTIALNSQDDYEGGGTWFEGLQQTDNDSCLVEMDAGQVTIRPGGVKHCGHAVTSGTRYIIGGFCLSRKKVETVRQLLTPDQAGGSQRDALEAAVALNPECDATYNLLANDYVQAGDKIKAQAALEYCLAKVHPLSGEVAYSLGTLYLEQEQYDKAKECMETCLEADDCDVDALMTLAQANAGLGDGAAEEACYQRVIQTASGSHKVITSAYCNLGVLNAGKEIEIEYYLKSLEYGPEAFEPRYSLGSAYANRKQWSEAVLAFRESLDRATDENNATLALQSLYKAAVILVQSEQPQPSSREAMITRLEEIMGANNYQKLATMRQ